MPAAEVNAQFEQFTVDARRSRGRLVTRNLVLAAEFIPHGRVADQDDVVLAAACDPRILCRAASELEGSAELRRLRVFQDVLGKDLRSVGLCEGLVAAAAATRPTMFVDPAVYFRLNTCVHHVC